MKRYHNFCNECHNHVDCLVPADEVINNCSVRGCYKFESGNCEYNHAVMMVLEDEDN